MGMVSVFFFLFLAPVIIIEQTACATSIGSLTEIKQHGDNGMDYFGITAGGEMAYHSQGWTKSTSHRGITTNAILQCRNKKIIASSEQDDETVLSRMLWL